MNAAKTDQGGRGICGDFSLIFGVFYALLDFYSSRGFIGRELNSESYEPLNTSEETNKFEETNAYANHLFTFAFLAADISIVILMQLVTFRM